MIRTLPRHPSRPFDAGRMRAASMVAAFAGVGRSASTEDSWTMLFHLHRWASAPAIKGHSGYYHGRRP
jgi:hypothetical protein